MIWNDRSVHVECGNFVASRVGKHDDFNFAATDPAAAFAGNVGHVVLGVRVDGNRLIIKTAIGEFFLTEKDGKKTISQPGLYAMII